MKEKKQFISVLFLMLAFNFSILFAQFSAPSALAATNTVNPAATGLVPCGGSEGEYAQKVLDNPTQATLQDYKNNSCQFADIFKLIARITNILVGLAGVYAILLIVVAGFKMVFSSGDQEMIKSGKEGLSNAVIGFVLVMIAYAVVNTIFELFNVKLTGQSSGFLYNPFIGK